MALISVVVSSYNRPLLILDALDSIADAGIPPGDIQVVVADDHSTLFDPHELEPLYDAIFNSFKVVQPEDVPSPEERANGMRCSVCINVARRYLYGRFVAYLPDDDFYAPNGLYVRERYLTNNPDHNVVYGRLEGCHCGTKRGRHFGPPHDPTSFYEPGPIESAANRVDHSMFMHRRERLGLAPPPWTTERSQELDCDDAAFLDRLRWCGWGPFYSVPDVVTVKRYHNKGHRVPGEIRE
jgi:hypothetical protein